MATTVAYAMPPPSSDPVTMWNFLEGGIDDIMTRPAHTDPKYYPQYMSLYTVAYNFSTSQMHGINDGRSGEMLYAYLTRYFIAHLKAMREHSDGLVDEILLTYWVREWDRYTTGSNYINRLFTYFNRHWVKHERNKDRKDVYPVYTLALVQWKQKLLLYVQRKQARLTGALLKLIEQQRNGKTIDESLVKKVVDSFITLDINQPDASDAYNDHFETAFIAATEEYYKQESAAFLMENSVSDYLKRAEERLKEEEDRVECYLHANTRKTLIRRCEHVLISGHVEVLLDHFQKSLDYDKEEDLQRMYILLSRIPENLEPFQKKFEEHVKKAGLAAVAKLVGPDGAGVDTLELKAYIDALLDVYRKYQETVNRNFRGEGGFVASLDKGCREYVNRNVATGSSTEKFPKLLAKYADALLRETIKLPKESDLDEALDQVMVLFKYVEVKDVFQAFYAIMLSTRLIRGISASDKSETSMISKLKKTCGFEYTDRLQRMLADVGLSKDHTASFNDQMARTHDAAELGVTFSAMVLSPNCWSLSAPLHEFTIPREILPTYERFRQYYQRKHCGQRLDWLWNFSRNEIQTNYLNQKYILMTSSYQMAVLVQYNDSDSMPLDELVAATRITKDLLTQVLTVLVKAKILLKEETDRYNLNYGFKSKKIYVNLCQPIKVESAPELKKMDEGRKAAIQHAAFRIMKAHKTLKNQALIQEVVTQICPKFTPRILDIKKAIDTLAEREYIERVEGSRDTWNFIA